MLINYFFAGITVVEAGKIMGLYKIFLRIRLEIFSNYNVEKIDGVFVYVSTIVLPSLGTKEKAERKYRAVY